MASAVHVAVGVVTDPDGRVLITRRRAGAHQGGLWEFPGGKVEAGEPVFVALRRELSEELGIDVEGAEPLIRIPHDYDDKRVLLDVWRVAGFRGEPRGLEGQPLHWVAPRKLVEYAFPAANRPILAALVLPPRCQITPEIADRERFLAGVDRALADGARFVQLRRHDLGETPYRELAKAVAARCRRAGALFGVNTVPDTALALQADVCHLSSQRARQCAASGRPVPASILLGVSCHSPGEIETALALQADYLFLSPVRATASHPASEPLGWQRFADWAAGLPVPVYALGGLGAGDARVAAEHGAHGIAGISAFWPDAG